MTKFNLSEEGFNQSSDVVAGTPRAQTPVRYVISCGRVGMLCGVADIVDLLTDHCQGPLTLRGKSDGQRFDADEVVLVLEGPFGELVTLETLCGGILSLSAGAANMAELVEAAGESIEIIDTSARRYPPELTAPLAIAAAVGGARGTSTPAGHAAVLERFGASTDLVRIGARSATAFRLRANVPCALADMFAGNILDATAALQSACPQASLRLPLGLDGSERDICTQAVMRFGSSLEAVRLDTPRDRLHQGGHEQATRTLEMRVLSQARNRAAAQAALEKYGFGPGVTIESVYGIRQLLDSQGARSTRIVVGGDFDVDKLRAFAACSAPVDAIETCAWVEFAEFTCRLAWIMDDGQWTPCRRADAVAGPIEPEGLPVIFQK